MVAFLMVSVVVSLLVDTGFFMDFNYNDTMDKSTFQNSTTLTVATTTAVTTIISMTTTQDVSTNTSSTTNSTTNTTNNK